MAGRANGKKGETTRGEKNEKEKKTSGDRSALSLQSEPRPFAPPRLLAFSLLSRAGLEGIEEPQCTWRQREISRFLPSNEARENAEVKGSAKKKEKKKPRLAEGPSFALSKKKGRNRKPSSPFGLFSLSLSLPVTFFSL